MKKLDAYKLIQKTIADCSEKVKLDYRVTDINFQTLIKQAEIEEEFGIAIETANSSTWFVCSRYSAIGLYGKEHSRTISWSDDGSQPNGEWLYQISFPTGAYIFGEDYCTETFEAFFAELKSFSPKYSDTNNHNLYFTSATAAKVHMALADLLKKYAALVSSEIKAKKILQLQAELERLGK